MNYDVFEKLCEKNNTTPTAITLKLGLTKGNSTSWKKGGNPSVEILMRLADELNCTTDYLLTGKEKSSFPDLSEEEQECLQKFKNLSPIDRGRILERMDMMYSAYTPEQKENVS